MGMIKYIPPTKKIIDHRNADGGYYEAICECCGTQFYPKKSNAKYCSYNCNLIMLREAKLSKGSNKLPKPGEKIPTPKVTSHNQHEIILNGKLAVINFFREAGAKHHGVVVRVKSLEVGDNMVWEGYNITRITSNKFGLSPTK